MTRQTHHRRIRDADDRREAMHGAVTDWVEELITAAQEACRSEPFQAWLAAQSQFHDYSYRNTLLIKRQCPEATKVAGYRTWQTEFDRHVTEGESAIWIWAPIITTRCPECHNAPSYHDDADCDYDETPPEAWDEGLVGFTPTAVFDLSQTEGEPLPELETAATGGPDGLATALVEAADELGVHVERVPADAWTHGDAAGVCTRLRPADARPVIEVKEREPAAVAGTLAHEYAHALLHSGTPTDSMRATRELEAEATAYVVGRHFGLDVSGSAQYVAAWSDDEPDELRERLSRISRTAEQIIAATSG